MRYLFLILLLNSYAVAENCNSMPTKTLKELDAAIACYKERNARLGISSYATTDRSSRAMGKYLAHRRDEQDRFDKLLTETRRNDLIEEQNEILRQQAQEDSNFRNQVLDELRN